MIQFRHLPSSITPPKQFAMQVLLSLQALVLSRDLMARGGVLGASYLACLGNWLSILIKRSGSCCALA